MKVVLRRAAKLDLLEARNWYEERQPGLGDAFLDEVEAVLQSLPEYPEMHPRVERRVRRAVLNRFPYGLFYEINGETIGVLAVLHGARSPEHWRRR
ncbi:MAG TPA: type II toxin-antitoxin system RelE/ParE family toxin [Thermoanaerobaculia bacterium]